jgi:hypothetical protein
LRTVIAILLFASSALAQVGFQPRISVTGSDGPNVWYDTTATLTGWLGIGASFMEWGSVTAAQAGTVTQLRVVARGGLSDQTIKVALYTNGTLCVSGTTGTITASSAEATYTITLGASSYVAAGTHKLAVSASGGVDVRVQSAGSGDFATQSYAGFPPGTLPTTEGGVALPVIGAYFD